MLLLLSLAHAEEPRPALPVTEIDFETVKVEGTLVKPEARLVGVTRQADFNPLIELRKDWKLETLQSVDRVR